MRRLRTSPSVSTGSTGSTGRARRVLACSVAGLGALLSLVGSGDRRALASPRVPTARAVPEAPGAPEPRAAAAASSGRAPDAAGATADGWDVAKAPAITNVPPPEPAPSGTREGGAERASTTQGRFGLEFFGGYARAGSFGDDATWCAHTTSCTRTAPPTGYRASATAVYEQPGGLAFYARVGWMHLGGTLERHHASAFNASGTYVPTAYDMTDAVTLGGLIFGAGLGYRLELGATFDLNARFLLEFAAIGVRDDVVGTGSGGGRTLSVTTTGSGTTNGGLMLDVVPELAVGATFGVVRVSLGAAFPLSILDGPGVPLGDTHPHDPQSQPTAYPKAIDGSPGIELTRGLRGFSSFLTIVPQASVGMWF
jgi:hypothetical protein